MFLLTLSTSVNQWSHFVTTVVMLKEEERVNKANVFLEEEGKQEEPSPATSKKTDQK